MLGKEGGGLRARNKVRKEDHARFLLNLLLVRSPDSKYRQRLYLPRPEKKNEREGKEVAIIDDKGMGVEASKYCNCRLLNYYILVVS
jgi:hypothetical protein